MHNSKFATGSISVSQSSDFHRSDEKEVHVSQGNRRQGELETPTNTSLPPPYFKKCSVGATPDRDINRV